MYLSKVNLVHVKRVRLNTENQGMDSGSASLPLLQPNVPNTMPWSENRGNWFTYIYTHSIFRACAK